MFFKKFEGLGRRLVTHCFVHPLGPKEEDERVASCSFFIIQSVFYYCSLPQNGYGMP